MGGVSGYWNYKIWNSGLAICYTNADTTFNYNNKSSTGTMGNLAGGSAYIKETLPISFIHAFANFISNGRVVIQASSKVSDNQLSIYLQIINSDADSCAGNKSIV